MEFEKLPIIVLSQIYSRLSSKECISLFYLNKSIYNKLVDSFDFWKHIYSKYSRADLMLENVNALKKLYQQQYFIENDDKEFVYYIKRQVYNQILLNLYLVENSNKRLDYTIPFEKGTNIKTIHWLPNEEYLCTAGLNTIFNNNRYNSSNSKSIESTLSISDTYRNRFYKLPSNLNLNDKYDHSGIYSMSMSLNNVLAHSTMNNNVYIGRLNGVILDSYYNNPDNIYDEQPNNVNDDRTYPLFKKLEIKMNNELDTNNNNSNRICVKLSKDGRSILVGSQSGSLVLYDIESNEILWEQHQPIMSINDIAINSDCTSLFAGGEVLNNGSSKNVKNTGFIRCWDIRTPSPLANDSIGYSNPPLKSTRMTSNEMIEVGGIALSTDNQMLGSVLRTGIARVYDLRTNTLQTTFVPKSTEHFNYHSSKFSQHIHEGICWVPHSNEYLCTTSGNIINIWNTNSNHQPLLSLTSNSHAKSLTKRIISISDTGMWLACNTGKIFSIKDIIGIVLK